MRHGSKGSKGQACAPIFAEQRDQDAEQQKQVAQQDDHELREEFGHLGDITVDALDHFARGVVVVEAHIQVKAVPGQLSAQGIGRGPGDIFAHVGDPDCHHLLDEGDADKQQRRDHQAVERAVPQGGVDKIAHDLRVDHLQANIAKQQDGQQDKTTPLGLDVPVE